jgi:pyruvate-ferredoxin/flavodoxin oxidoreductase
VWESDVDGEHAWQNLPIWARKQIIEKKIRVFTLPGFEIARKATDRADLQLRMQGNAFLGAFFAVSPMLQEFGITQEQFRDVVFKQYVKKFGKLGDAVVQSNMEVMLQGFERVKEITIGAIAAADHSSLRGQALLPIFEAVDIPEFAEAACTTGAGCRSHAIPEGQGPRTPVSSVATFDAEFRSNYGYNQPSTPLSAMGVIAAATGDTASKYVARRETPLYIPENCTQCMECISVCPDTALPNCSQDLGTLLSTAVSRYVADPAERRKMLLKLPEIEKLTRQRMLADIKTGTPLPQIVREQSTDSRPRPRRSFSALLKKFRWLTRR